MGTLSREEAERFWRRIHKQGADDLAAVCFPGEPRYFNLFFHRIQRFALRRHLKDGRVSLAKRRVLDLGSGRGRWLSFYSDQYGARAVGVDIATEAVRDSRRRGCMVCQGSVTKLPFSTAGFDLVSSVTVLMHLPPSAQKEAAKEIGRVLRSGGSLTLIEGTIPDAAPHVYNRSVAEWIQLFEAADLKVSFVEGHCFNVVRRRWSNRLYSGRRVAIYLDYIFDFALMAWLKRRPSALAMQHLMVFEKL